MAGNNSFFMSIIRHPFSFSIMVLCVVILFIWFDYKSTVQPTTPSGTNPSGVANQKNGSSVSGGTGENIKLAPPSIANSGRTQPRIMDQFGTSPEQGKSGVPAIDALVGRLEEKVNSDPSNIGNRILLAQTYKELGRAPDALQELRKIQKEAPDNSRAKLVLASILSHSSDPKELEESLQLLSAIKADPTVQDYLINLYRGDAMIRQENHEGALASWKQALTTMPETDARYVILEKKVMDLTNSASSTSSKGS